MPPRFEFEFLYSGSPRIIVNLHDSSGRYSIITQALVDTGADRSLFDRSLIDTLRLSREDEEPVAVTGIGGALPDASLLQVQVSLLDEPDLTIVLPVVFAPIGGLALGNLIGLDVLEHFDFGISHAERLGYLGRHEP